MKTNQSKELLSAIFQIVVTDFEPNKIFKANPVVLKYYKKTIRNEINRTLRRNCYCYSTKYTNKQNKTEEPR